MVARKEASVPPELLERILAFAGTGMVLVGGQALAFWAAYYQTPAPAIAVTKDIDMLGTRADVKRLAHNLNAHSAFPSKRAISVLAGEITKDLSDGEYIHIDVLLRVYGDITNEAIKRRAVLAENPAGRFRVMHPIDVLQGRLENVYGLTDKQDEHGLAQLRLAIDVAREFLRDIASREGSGPGPAKRPATLRHMGRIESLALSDTGRKVAQRFGIHVADAVYPEAALHLTPFLDKKLPQLMTLMSAVRRAEVQQLVSDYRAR